jgi:hypothetical protein
MEEIVNLITTDAQPSAISDEIKNALYATASKRIDAIRSKVANSLFDQSESEEE